MSNQESLYNSKIANMVSVQAVDLSSSAGGEAVIMHAPEEYIQYMSFSPVEAMLSDVLNSPVTNTTAFANFLSPFTTSGVSTAISAVSTDSPNYDHWKKLFIIDTLLNSFQTTANNSPVYTFSKMMIDLITSLTSVDMHSNILSSFTESATINANRIYSMTISNNERMVLINHIGIFGIVNHAKQAASIAEACARQIAGCAEGRCPVGDNPYDSSTCTFFGENMNSFLKVLVLYYLLREESRICTSLFTQSGGYGVPSFQDLLTQLSTQSDSIAGDATEATDTGDGSSDPDAGAGASASDGILARARRLVYSGSPSIRSLLSSLRLKEPSSTSNNDIRDSLIDSKSALMKNNEMLNNMTSKVYNAESRLRKIWWENLFMMLAILIYVVGMIIFILIPSIPTKMRGRIVLIIATVMIMAMILITMMNLIQKNKTVRAN